MIDHKNYCSVLKTGECNCQPPKPPKGNGGIGHSSERTELTVNDMTQHVYQHQSEPRDLDYRAQAFSFALTSVGPVRAHVTSLIDVAAQIEEYLRNGKP